MVALRVGGAVPPPKEPVLLRERPSTGIGHDTRLVAEPDRRSNPHLPATISPPREGFPLLVTPKWDGSVADLAEWAEAARPVIDSELRTRGAVLLRGLPIATAAELSAFLRALDYPTMNTHGVR